MEYKAIGSLTVKNDYLQRNSFCEPQIITNPNSDLQLVVVIPCFNEFNLLDSLKSLYNCELPQKSVEIITVINHSEIAEETIKQRNKATFFEAQQWAGIVNTEQLKFYFIKAYELPKKHAGVGLARKIGMDEAVYRLDTVNCTDGVIICFDADAKCETNYLIEIEKHFSKNSNSSGCSIRFEHPISGNNYSEKIYEGIVFYELFLRYYRQGLKFAGHPYSFHTIGSSMAVRTSAYQKQGGMNRKKAGEDFYFLQKIIALGNFTELNTTKIFPSPRASDRVPFGTGTAINKWLENTDNLTKVYHPQTFYDLQLFFKAISSFYNYNIDKTVYSEALNSFLESVNFNDKLTEIRANCTSESSFVRRFYNWFNLFLCLKYVHFVRDNFYPERDLITAANQLYNTDFKTAVELLLFYREMER